MSLLAFLAIAATVALAAYVVDDGAAGVGVDGGLAGRGVDDGADGRIDVCSNIAASRVDDAAADIEAPADAGAEVADAVAEAADAGVEAADAGVEAADAGAEVADAVPCARSDELTEFIRSAVALRHFVLCRLPCGTVISGRGYMRPLRRSPTTDHKFSLPAKDWR